jgi:hypothetical protein
VAAGTAGQWTLMYEAGEHGIAAGGVLFLQVSPFWGWSTPQTTNEHALGYTTVDTDALGVTLEPRTVDTQLLAVEVTGRALAAGERVTFVYGAGSAGARGDRYAERRAPLWFAVDGDGDGIRSVVADSPVVEISPASAQQLVLTLPSSAAPGASVQLTVAVLDGAGNRGPRFAEWIVLETDAPGVELPSRARLDATDVIQVPLKLSQGAAGGVVRIRATGAGLSAESNPLVVSADGVLPILWGDLHGHSVFSDGTGSVEDYFRYARDVAALDVIALTDHDHWGMRPLSQNPDLWSEIRSQTLTSHEPGRFVTLLAYEWTSWLHGHRHVLYFSDAGDVLSSVDPAYEDPRQLWEALRGQPAMTLAHHSAGGPVATNWQIPPDPELEPLTEVASVHGSSEAMDSPRVIYQPIAGNFVRDALDLGYRFGFIGSGDSHDGHPGLAHLDAGTGGLAAFLTGDLTRAGIRSAMKHRRVYATNGPRIVLRTSLADARMGESISPAAAADLRVVISACAPLERVDIIRSGNVVDTAPGEGRRDVSLAWALADLRSGEYVYVRAVQEDGGAAWSSPFFID